MVKLLHAPAPGAELQGDPLIDLSQVDHLIGCKAVLPLGRIVAGEETGLRLRLFFPPDFAGRQAVLGLLDQNPPMVPVFSSRELVDGPALVRHVNGTAESPGKKPDLLVQLALIRDERDAQSHEFSLRLLGYIPG